MNTGYLGKRTLDLCLSIPALLVLSPVFVCISIIIRLRMGGPVFFAQQRPGMNKKSFTIYKFRTMIDQYDVNGKLLPDSARLTTFGRFLRSTSLDELPELLNVIKGEMSLVGPRPLLVSYLPYYTETEQLRHTVLPGITGWAQTKGRNYLSWNERLSADVWYVQHQSLVLDIKIMVATLFAVLKREGVAVITTSVMQDLDEERREQC